MCYSFRSSLMVALEVVLLTALISVDAGCLQEPKLCCDGKNNTCRRDGARITNNDSFTCFCDSVCSQLGDCCVDYGATCQAVDCALDAEWTDWTPCDVTCGSGFRRRYRKIVRPASNGGKDCDPVMERTSCEVHDCPTPLAEAQEDQENKPPETDDAGTEFAKIIPVAVEELAYSDSYGLSNSDHRNQSSSSPIFVRYHHSRLNDNNNNNNNDNDDDSYLQYDDHHRAKTSARGSNEKAYYAVFDLTDVRSACLLSTQWPRWMTNGARVCVDCRALAIRRRTGNQCKGHGMTSRETRWITVTIPGCHGKWILKTQHEQGSCQAAGYHLDFLFE